MLRLDPRGLSTGVVNVRTGSVRQRPSAAEREVAPAYSVSPVHYLSLRTPGPLVTESRRALRRLGSWFDSRQGDSAEGRVVVDGQFHRGLASGRKDPEAYVV